MLRACCASRPALRRLRWRRWRWDWGEPGHLQRLRWRHAAAAAFVFGAGAAGALWDFNERGPVPGISVSPATSWTIAPDARSFDGLCRRRHDARKDLANCPALGEPAHAARVRYHWGYFGARLRRPRRPRVHAAMTIGPGTGKRDSDRSPVARALRRRSVNGRPHDHAQRAERSRRGRDHAGLVPAGVADWRHDYGGVLRPGRVPRRALEQSRRSRDWRGGTAQNGCHARARPGGSPCGVHRPGTAVSRYEHGCPRQDRAAQRRHRAQRPHVAADAAWCSRPRASGRVCEPGEPADRARHWSTARSGDPHGARREPVADCGRSTHARPGAGGTGRCRRTAVRRVDPRRGGGYGAGVDSAPRQLGRQSARAGRNRRYYARDGILAAQ